MNIGLALKKAKDRKILKMLKEVVIGKIFYDIGLNPAPSNDFVCT